MKIGLDDLTKTTEKLRFRFWCKNQLVEIWTTDLSRFQGRLISYTTRYDPEEYRNLGKKQKFHAKYIDTTTSKPIYERAASMTLFDIPDQANIKGWKQGVDGYSTLFRVCHEVATTPELSWWYALGRNQRSCIQSIAAFKHQFP